MSLASLNLIVLLLKQQCSVHLVVQFLASSITTRPHLWRSWPPHCVLLHETYSSPPAQFPQHSTWYPFLYSCTLVPSERSFPACGLSRPVFSVSSVMSPTPHSPLRTPRLTLYVRTPHWLRRWVLWEVPDVGQVTAGTGRGGAGEACGVHAVWAPTAGPLCCRSATAGAVFYSSTC